MIKDIKHIIAHSPTSFEERVLKASTELQNRNLVVEIQYQPVVMPPVGMHNSRVTYTALVIGKEI